MKIVIKELFISLRATLVLGVLLCGVFPVVVWGLGQLLFPAQANGSLIENRDGQVIGSAWIGQNFAAAKYFHPRPSAAGANGYDAANSSGSNLGPTSQKLIDAVKQRAETYRVENNLSSDALIPGDSVTASGSGLDPHISPRNAQLQIPRVARERGLSADVVREQVARATEGRSLGLLGEPGVNVLKLNLALDQLNAPQTSPSSAGFR